MRWLTARVVRRLALALAFPAIAFVGANIAIERVAESRLAAAVQTTFDLEEPPTVNLSGFPIIFNVLRGNLPGLAFQATGVTVEDLSLRTVSVSMDDIRADGSFLNAANLRITIGRGQAVAEADETSLNRFLKRRKQDATVKLAEGFATVRARRTVAGRRRTVVATGEIELRKGILRFRPVDVTVDGESPPRALRLEAERKARLDLEFPELPGGIKPTAVVLHRGFIEVRADLRDYRLDLGDRGSR